MCQITINPSFAGTPTNTGASVTVSGTVATTAGDPGPCAKLQVSVICAHSNVASSNTTAPDAQGNWTITLPVTCTCNDMIEVNVKCLSPVNCQAAAHGPIVCGGGGTGTGGVGPGTFTIGGIVASAGTPPCRPKVSVLGFSFVVRCQLTLLIMSIGWGIGLGMFTFYLGLGPASKASFGTTVMVIGIVAAAIALLATIIYLLFCRKCLCWFWLLIWRVLWLGGILASWFRNPACGPNCLFTSYIGVALMIVALIVLLFVWSGACNKTICDIGYEGILYTVAVFFPIVLPLVFGFSTCTVSLMNNNFGPPWGFIVLGSANALFIVLMWVGLQSNSCTVTWPPPEWDL